MSPSTPWWNLLKLQAKYPRGKSKLQKGISTFLKAYKQWNLQTQILSSLHVNPWRTRIIYKWHQYYVTYIHRLLFLNTCKKVVKVLVAQLYPTLCDPMDYSPPGSSVHGDSPGKNTRVSCHALLRGIFPTQGLNLGLLCRLHWQVCSLPLVPPGKPLNTWRCDQ